MSHVFSLCLCLNAFSIQIISCDYVINSSLFAAAFFLYDASTVCVVLADALLDDRPTYIIRNSR